MADEAGIGRSPRPPEGGLAMTAYLLRHREERSDEAISMFAPFPGEGPIHFLRSISPHADAGYR